MRELAAYSFEATRDPATGAPVLPTISAAVDAWLASKGPLTPDGSELALPSGNVATVERSTGGSPGGAILTIILTEPTPGGWFRTTITMAENESSVGVSVLLAAGSASLMPLSVDVRCPRIVRSLLSLPIPWHYGASQVAATPHSFAGTVGGDAFIDLVWNDSRSLPVIAVSDEYGAVLHPEIVEGLASDLAGVALVARLDVDASWRITARKGKMWSCYGGAIRLYWPCLTPDSSPLTAPLWTPRRLLEGVPDTEIAASRIRAQLRRKVFSQAAFAVAEPAFFADVRRLASQEEMDALRNKAQESSDYKSLAEEYFNKAEEFARRLGNREDEIGDLKRALANAQLALRFRDEGPGAVQPSEEIPPASVEEAVLEAMERYGQDLLFGGAVNESIRSLAPDAGPPDKILSYLGTLAEMTRARRSGSLGTTAVGWLRGRGVACSPESDTIRNSKAGRKERTWDDGSGGGRYFDLHLKPSDATSPDRCVRIYFEYDEASQMTIVGWVGRKPGL